MGLKLKLNISVWETEWDSMRYDSMEIKTCWVEHWIMVFGMEPEKWYTDDPTLVKDWMDLERVGETDGLYHTMFFSDSLTIQS